MRLSRRTLLLGLPALASPAAAQGLDALPTAQLTAQAPYLPPLALYTLAQRSFAAGQRDDAVRWFYAAQIRARYRLATAPDLAPDGEPALYASLNDVLGRPINGWAFGDVDAAAARIADALAWDAAHENAVSPKTADPAALARIREGLAAFRTDMLSRKEEIRRERAANGLANR